MDGVTLASAPIVSLIGYPTSDTSDPEVQYNVLALAEESSSTSVDGVQGSGALTRKVRYVKVTVYNTQSSSATIKIVVFGGASNI